MMDAVDSWYGYRSVGLAQAYPQLLLKGQSSMMTEVFELEVPRKMSGSTQLDSRRSGIRLEHRRRRIQVWIVVGP